MPIYEFKCKKCGRVFEELMKHSDPQPGCDLAVITQVKGLLERCDGEVEKLISKNNFVLKGGCWSKDGYGSR